jgi:hypothetical protein
MGLYIYKSLGYNNGVKAYPDTYRWENTLCPMALSTCFSAMYRAFCGRDIRAGSSRLKFALR